MSEEHSPFNLSPTEQEYEKEHERNVQKASGVWFSGLLSRESYVAPPKRNPNEDLYDDAHLTQTNYTVPRGYIYSSANIPDILLDKPSGTLRVGSLVYTATMALSFALLVASVCPITWLKGKGDATGVKMTVWKLKQNGETIDLCTFNKQFLRAMAGSCIVGLIFAFFACVAGFLKLMKGKGSYGVMLLLGFLSFSWSLCGSAMAIGFLDGWYCGYGSKVKDQASLDVGFALSFAAWVVACIGTLLLGILTHFNVGPALKDIRTYDSMFFILVVVALIFTCVASGGTMFQRNFKSDNIKCSVGYWNVRVKVSNGILPMGLSQYRCSSFETRVRVSVAFLILASIALFFAAIFSIPAFLKSPFRITACFLTILAAIFLTINWVTAVVVMKMKHCNQSTKSSLYEKNPGIPSGINEGLIQFTSYSLAEGVILPIVAWVVCIVAVVANIMIPWPRDKRSMLK